MKGKGTHFERVTFNGKELSDARIEHADLMQGGELVFFVSKKGKEAKKPFPAWEQSIPKVGTIYSQGGNKKAQISFTLNRQFRTWPLTYGWQGDTLIVTCKEAVYKHHRSVVEHATGFCWDIPSDGAVYETNDTFAFISRQAASNLKTRGSFLYDGITWRVVDHDDLHVKADIDQTEMFIEYREDLGLYIVKEMRHNPLGIDWRIVTNTSF